MSSAITILGEHLISQYIGNQEALVIDRFILANVAGLDPEAAVDRGEQLPDPGDIVHTYDIPGEYKGYVNANQVVYSMLLGSNVGDFDFNWLGLYSSADDVVVAITYLLATAKWQTDPGSGTLGNNLTRNFLLEFTGAQECTGITVTAATWQIDFTVRLAGLDERERTSNRDVYGRACFWNDGWKVWNDAGTHKLQAGVGYVEGIRIQLAAAEVIAPGVLPKDVWLDVSLQTSGADVVAVIEPLFATAAQADYTDANQFEHYLVKIAAIDVAGLVTDLRRTEAIPGDVVAYMRAHADATAPHAATSAATPGRLIIRDENGRAQVAAPAAAADCARKADVDGVIPSGTVMLFAQTAAPTGFAKLTTHNNKALRVVSGTAGNGGTVAFTTAFTSARGSSYTVSTGTVGSTTLTTTMMPVHNHPIYSVNVPGTGGMSGVQVTGNGSPYGDLTTYINSAGGGASHPHALTMNQHAHNTDLNVQYVDVILASRN